MKKIKWEPEPNINILIGTGEALEKFEDYLKNLVDKDKIKPILEISVNRDISLFHSTILEILYTKKLIPKTRSLMLNEDLVKIIKEITRNDLKFENIYDLDKSIISLLAIFSMIYKYKNDYKTILIEGIESLLYPGWQKKIINILRENFSDNTFLVTTNSPFILTGCYNKEVSKLWINKNGFGIKKIDKNFLGTNISEVIKYGWEGIV